MFKSSLFQRLKKLLLGNMPRMKESATKGECDVLENNWLGCPVPWEEEEEEKTEKI